MNYTNSCHPWRVGSNHKFFCSSGDGGAGAIQDQANQQQKAIKAATNQINQSFSGFDDAFYNQNTQNQENAMMPGLEQQFQKTQNNLGFKLSGQGLQKSSQAKQLGESLGTELGQEKENIANAALGSTNQLKQNVNQTQQNLISQAEVANDPGQVAQGALSTAGTFSSPSLLAPVAGLFNNWSNMYLGQQNNNTYNNAAAGYSSFGGGGGQNLPSYGSSFNTVSTGR